MVPLPRSVQRDPLLPEHPDRPDGPAKRQVAYPTKNTNPLILTGGHALLGQKVHLRDAD